MKLRDTTPQSSSSSSHISRASRWREAALVVGALALAGAVRLALAARGWPYADSDEATMGLMADDILRHGAHPLFFYGQNYLGAFQAYLAAPFFAVIGPTNLALYAATTFEILLFLLILYFLTRLVFSPTIALLTVCLLAIGPYEALYFDLRAGAGLQETLVFGALLLLLAFLRMRMSLRRRSPVTPATALRGALLDLVIGAVAGLALWAHLLTVPFILTAVALPLTQRALQLAPGRQRAPATVSASGDPEIDMGRQAGIVAPQDHSDLVDQLDTKPTAALTIDQLMTQPVAAARVAAPPTRAHSLQTLAALAGQTLLIIVGFVGAAFPFLSFNVTHHWATFNQTLGIAGSGGSPHPGLTGHIISLIQQVAATLLIGLPRLLNETLLCPTCVEWPRPHTIVSHTQMLHEAIIAAPLSCFVIALWAVNAADLLPKPVRKRLRVPSFGGWEHWRAAVEADPALWWGRALFVTAAALVFLEYVASRASYATPDTSARYLIGVYVCAPLVVAPLVRWSRIVWKRRSAHAGDLDRSPQTTATTPRMARRAERQRLLGYASAAALVAVVLVSLAGVATTFNTTRDRSQFGVPAGTRDMQLINYLLAHHETQFYTSYWVCDRLMFEAAERLTCAVVNDTDPFINGVNRIGAYRLQLGATPHPVYVFDDQDTNAPTLTAQMMSTIAAGAPRVRGDVVTTVAGYHIFTYMPPSG